MTRPSCLVTTSPHDLRASLRHVTAYVQIVMEDLGDQLSASTAGHLNTVSQAARQMGRQIDGLTELSRLTRSDLQWSTAGMGALLRDVQGTMASALAGRVVEWTVAPDFPALRCDVVMVRQVLTLLLSNALKFTTSRPIVEIKVSWQVMDGGLCAVTVGDNGVGFNPLYTDRLFRAFQRLHSAREFEGLGMGLALARKIIERHGGTTWAVGVPNEGCSVSFTLPLA